MFRGNFLFEIWNSVLCQRMEIMETLRPVLNGKTLKMMEANNYTKRYLNQKYLEYYKPDFY